MSVGTRDVDLKRLAAVIPGGHGLQLHLHLPGYRPGRRVRSIGDSAALCGVLLSARETRVPLADGLDLKPTGTDPRTEFVWCRVCIGHVVSAAGLDRAVLELVFDQIKRTPA